MDISTLHGMGVALVTPFTENKAIDFKALASLIDYQIDAGADFIVALGTTAETPTLSVEEQFAVARFVVDRTAGRVPLVIGIGGNSTQAVIERVNSGIANGYDAILSVTPFYNKPQQEGLYQHFVAVANASPLPIILYNVPSRTGVNMHPDTTLRLATHPNIAGIKEASGIIGQADKIISLAPAGFRVFAGDDSLTLPMISIGGNGVISVLGNAYPKLFADLVHQAEAGHYAEALTLHRKFTSLYKLLFAEGNPPGIKCLLSVMGLCESALRLPMVEVSDGLRQKIASCVDEIKE